MASYNRVVLVGNLTRDPQLSYTPSNTAVCKFGIATNRTFKDREGNSRDETCFVDCTVFSRAAETFNRYMSKGRQVLVEGRLQLQQWTTKDGDKRSKHEVIVENFTFLGTGRGGGDADRGAPATAGAADAADAGYEPPPPPAGDDIPF